MEVNENDSIFSIDIDNSVDGSGSEFLEDSGLEKGSEEIEKSEYFEDESGRVDDDDDNFIDYSALATSIRSATPTYQLDTDLDDLQITDICLLLVLLLLGLIIVGGKSK